MKCPHCDEGMDVPITDIGPPGEPVVMYCSCCRLEGPREVLEALAARLAPAGVLEAAERLLRERAVHMAAFRSSSGVTLWGADRCKVTSRGTLADAVARLDKPQVTGGRDG